MYKLAAVWNKNDEINKTAWKTYIWLEYVGKSRTKPMSQSHYKMYETLNLQ